MVIVSYNGFLDVREEDFEAIVRDLTVLSDHKLVLFPNLSAMHQRSEAFLDESGEGDWSESRIRLVD